MIERPKPPMSMEEEARLESWREKIVERLVWLRNDDPQSFHQAIGVFIGVEIISTQEPADIALKIATDTQFANSFAEKFDIETEKLRSPEYIPKELFFSDESLE